MTLDPALLAAVVAQPDDDLIRLQAADWLDEHGQPDRAELVRVQCRLNEGSPGLPPFGPEEWAVLRRRELSLSNHQIQHWLPIPPAGYHRFFTSAKECGWSPNRGPATAVTCVLFEFHRGFASVVTCTFAEWSRHADAILNACPIRNNTRDGLVRLTTWPDEPPLNDRGIKRLLELRYPGVPFELPTAPADRAAFTYADESHDLTGRVIDTGRRTAIRSQVRRSR